MVEKQYPYKSFGEELRKLRARAAKTPAEVSGAVEIDESRLKLYEAGEQRPTEDILLLLIQHFNLNDSQADKLWKLAGYSGKPDEDKYANMDEIGNIPQLTVSLIPQDTRIVYTDMVQVMVNNYGAIINFMQGASLGNNPLAVAKVGMSKEHARSLIEILQKTLNDAENPPKQKLLDKPTDKNE